MQPAIVVGSTAQVTGIHIIDKHITKTTNASPGVIGFGRFVLSVSVDIKSRENSAVMTSMGTTGLSSNFCYCCFTGFFNRFVMAFGRTTLGGRCLRRRSKTL